MTRASSTRTRSRSSATSIVTSVTLPCSMTAHDTRRPLPERGARLRTDLRDGRHLLIVTNDNDFVPTQPNRFLAFAVERADLPGFQPQDFDRLSRSCFQHVR
jgi:hypothetical protein